MASVGTTAGESRIGFVRRTLISGENLSGEDFGRCFCSSFDGTILGQPRVEQGSLHSQSFTQPVSKLVTMLWVVTHALGALRRWMAITLAVQEFPARRRKASAECVPTRRGCE